MRLGFESDDSILDFSGDDEDEEYDHNNDSSSHTSVEKTTNRAKNDRNTRKASNQSLQHNFDGMGLNSTFGSIPGYNAGMNDDEQMEMNDEHTQKVHDQI